MDIKILESRDIAASMRPLSDSHDLISMPLAGADLAWYLKKRLEQGLAGAKAVCVELHCDFWPGDACLELLRKVERNTRLIDSSGRCIGQIAVDGKSDNATEIVLDDSAGLLITYPWDILALNEQIVGELSESQSKGVIREHVVIDGFCRLGEGSVLLPGVYIEGNVIIGRNCKIGPNCYIRGNTAIGDNCHIGQAVEIKNSLLMNKVSAGHLSYIGDSVICENTNLGAGTISANLRHDGKNQRSMVERHAVDTQRRKLGTIIGANVHTGIHTSIYPGRKIASGASTLPGEVVRKDIGFH